MQPVIRFFARHKSSDEYETQRGFRRLFPNIVSAKYFIF